MAISGNYATPVMVNGYLCRDCTDVDYAKKHIDPAHPQSGPYNVDASTDPTRKDQAVSFGGAPTGHNPGQTPSANTPYTPGSVLVLLA